MARHRDINRIHAQLSGEGWHIEYHSEAVPKSKKNKVSKKKKYKPIKKDKRRCIYYNKRTKSCYKLKTLCMGSSNCQIYHD